MNNPMVSLLIVAFILLVNLSFPADGRHGQRLSKYQPTSDGNVRQSYRGNHDDGLKVNHHNKWHRVVVPNIISYMDRITTRRSSRNRREDQVPTVTKSDKKTNLKKNALPEGSAKAEVSMSCEITSDCNNLTNSICDTVSKSCMCDDDLSVHIEVPPSCVRPAALNAACTYDAQCVDTEPYSLCDAKQLCVCISGYEMKMYPDVGVNCAKTGKGGDDNVDPAMIGVLAGLALMFVIICVVLRLFSKARFRENRSIFNTPNPRLMNASLFKDSKLLSPSRGARRGSRASVRGPPSRAPSVTSVNKEGRSPNGSLAKGRRGSVLSTVSATGSTIGAATQSPSPGHATRNETTVSIEAVD